MSSVKQPGWRSFFGVEIARRIRVVIIVRFEARLSCHRFYLVIKLKLDSVLSSILELKTELLEDFISILERAAF
jgi:hypothetical protein